MDPHNELFRRSGFDLTIDGLFKDYQTGAQSFSALRGVSCDIRSGQVTVIQGPSGCGKTTLMNILGGVDSVDRGTVVIGGKNLAAETDEGRLARYRLEEVGFIFQAFNLIPGLTAIDNLHLPMTVSGKGTSERAKRGNELLALVGLADKAQKRPDELSGGEQQRVAVALALVNDPRLILADEPTGNLDSKNSNVVTDLLLTLAHEFGKTVVIATHDVQIGARGDKNMHMRDGAFESSDAIGGAG